MAVLGAGIMGCCLALELAQRGCKVDLFDLQSRPMTGASLHNEGKLHLGFVYAKDPHKETHRLMVRGSLSFSRILEKLTGFRATGLLRSKPFHYFVAADSQLRIDAVEDHFREVERAIRDVSRDTGDLYLGTEADAFYVRNSAADHASMFSPARTQGSFSTRECSVSPVAVAAILTQAIRNQPNVEFIGNAEILEAGILASGDVELTVRRERETCRTRYPCAANCLWDDKLRLDRIVGVSDQGTYFLRYKATITITPSGRLARTIPSATGILGPYGDVVSYDERSYYISWYPLCKLAETTDADGRRLRDRVHKGAMSRAARNILSGVPALAKAVAPIAHRKFVKANIAQMAAYVPPMSQLLERSWRCDVSGGVIVARGSSDIDDPQSHLHQRFAVGPVSHGSYVTIDTGKYCTAPLFALQAADMVEDITR